MRNDKIILTDVDGVLLDWDEAFNEYMELNGYKRIPDSDMHYQLSKRYYDVKDEDTRRIVNDLNTSPVIAHLNPLPGAVENVKKLAKEGYRFICITAVSDNPIARVYRKKNLQNVFGDDVFLHDEMVCIASGASKSHELKAWAGTGYFWIEDHFRNAEAGYEVGLNPILYNQPYNEHFHTDLFPRVDTWDEIYGIIKAAE